jgi:hypothetical protein
MDLYRFIIFKHSTNKDNSDFKKTTPDKSQNFGLQLTLSGPGLRNLMNELSAQANPSVTGPFTPSHGLRCVRCLEGVSPHFARRLEGRGRVK